MANGDDEICKHFIIGDEPETRWFNAVGAGNGGWGGNTRSGLWAEQGTYRLSYRQESGRKGASSLWSYRRWCVAVRFIENDEAVIIVNGDSGPSHMTRQHQSDLRSVLRKTEMKHAFLPFSALRAARIHNPATDITIVATTEDRRIQRKVKVKNKETGKVEERTIEDHFLGETLFASGGRYYVSGLDRNDAPQRRKFYLARLPDMRRSPPTVDAALDKLRPKNVPKDALRQGEWFLVEAPDFKPAKGAIHKTHPGGYYMGDKTESGKIEERGVPILFAQPDEMTTALTSPNDGSYVRNPFRDRHLRHRASQMAITTAVYVRGMLRDVEHGPLKLGDGKTWFRVYRNLADGSWGATGDVD